MKITDIKAFVTKPPGRLLELRVRQGFDGRGDSRLGRESSIGATSVAAVVDEFGAAIVGKDPFRIEEHWQDMYHLHHNVRGGALQMAAISGIEIALWDIKGKAAERACVRTVGRRDAGQAVDLWPIRRR